MPKRALIESQAACTDLEFAAGDGDRGAFAREQRGGTLSDGSRAGEHHGALALQRAAVREPRHGGRRGGVRAVAVEHHRDAEFAEKFVLHRREQRLALGHVAAADEDRRVFLVLRAAREDRALDQAADVARVHAAVGGDVIGAAVVADDVVENRGQGIRIELIEQFFHGLVIVAAPLARMLKSRDAAACPPPRARYYRSIGRRGTAWRHPRPMRCAA